MFRVGKVDEKIVGTIKYVSYIIIIQEISFIMIKEYEKILHMQIQFVFRLTKHSLARNVLLSTFVFLSTFFIICFILHPHINLVSLVYLLFTYL